MRRIGVPGLGLPSMEPFADIRLDTDLTVVGSGHFFRVGEEQFGVRA